MDGNIRFGRDFCVGNERGGAAGKCADRLISLSNTSIMKLLFIRVYLKTPDAPGQRAFSRRAASFFLEIRQYSCEKMSCAARKFLAAGHIGSFQIHPREVRIGCDRVGMVRMVGGQDER